MLTVTFYGVRGSTPCPCAANARYGGNTACVVLEVPGEDPIVLDLGTGLRPYGETLAQDQPFRGTALVTHMHWDHVQGLPFFSPILRNGASLDVYGPVEGEVGLSDAFAQFMRPPFFPVRIDDLPGEIRFHDAHPGTFTMGAAQVTVASVPHVGATNGYRIETGGASIAYVSDHQQPGIDDWEISESVIDLCRDVDVLIHDAQYSADEFIEKTEWGHCTSEYAVAVASAANAKRLVLFHHDPSHDDSVLDDLADRARMCAASSNLEEIIVAAEGLTVALGQSTARTAVEPARVASA